MVKVIPITVQPNVMHASQTLNQMERKKQVKAPALLKMETFLNAVYLRIGNGETFSLDAVAREYKLSGSVATVIKKLKIVDKLAPNTWLWFFPTPPDKSLAITVLDEVNRFNGNWKNKMLDKALDQAETPKDLFSSAKDRSDLVYLVGSVAAGVYADPSIRIDTDEAIDSVNERIIFTAHNLINKINNLKF